MQGMCRFSEQYASIRAILQETDNLIDNGFGGARFGQIKTHNNYFKPKKTVN